jgi:putative nucleotidyltransferase with HDIG domain
MVLNALSAMPDFQRCSPQQQELLWAAALLHDVEKRNTTQRDENGRIQSLGHARKGVSSSRQKKMRG